MSRQRRLSPEEADLWRRAMRSTNPLPGAHLPDVSISLKSNRKPASEAPLPVAARPPREVRGTAHDPFQSGLDGATARRVRRGRVTPEGKIDLHGMRKDEARGALERFLYQSADRGRRCVLVITGKGGRMRGARDDASFMRGPDAEGVLRRQVPMWLGELPLRQMIFAVEPAHQKDGGGGAFYVFLRKSVG